PEADLAIRITISNAYKTLGLPKQARPHAQEALDLQRRLYGPDHILVANRLMDYAWLLRMDRDGAGAERCAREAIAIFQKRNADAKQILAAFIGLQNFLFSQ